MVLLDAAKGCGTAPPDLTRFPADFVAMSFYKVNILIIISLKELYELRYMDLCIFINRKFVLCAFLKFDFWAHDLSEQSFYSKSFMFQLCLGQ